MFSAKISPLDMYRESFSPGRVRGQSEPLANIVRSDMNAGKKGEFADISSFRRNTADLKTLAAQRAELSAAPRSQLPPSGAREPAEAGSPSARKRTLSGPS
jgi:hypothetical protein